MNTGINNMQKETKTVFYKNSFVIHTHTKIIDYEWLYRQHKRIFDECDYMFQRHNVKVCLAVFKMTDNDNSISSVAFKNMLRLTDKYIPSDTEEYHIVLFTFCNIKMAYQAISRIEKTLIMQLKAFNHIKGFKCAVMQRKASNSLFGILKECCHLVETNQS